ncbi:unnamed protein product [Prorocentrum cordatum]|uniref:Uncharacterized protein n=1 Tax=Prorocentrum cordatum TaxID=2364126 RepID=A0ABN9X5P1_9DINO|nr:unnamed protein product [Polarella glacialis]
MRVLTHEMFVAEIDEIEKERDWLHEAWFESCQADEDRMRFVKQRIALESLQLFICDLVYQRIVELFGDEGGTISWSRFGMTIASRGLCSFVSGRTIDPTGLIDDILLDRSRMHSKGLRAARF